MYFRIKLLPEPKKSSIETLKHTMVREMEVWEKIKHTEKRKIPMAKAYVTSGRPIAHATATLCLPTSPTPPVLLLF